MEANFILLGVSEGQTNVFALTLAVKPRLIVIAITSLHFAVRKLTSCTPPAANLWWLFGSDTTSDLKSMLPANAIQNSPVGIGVSH